MPKKNNRKATTTTAVAAPAPVEVEEEIIEETFDDDQEADTTTATNAPTAAEAEDEGDESGSVSSSEVEEDEKDPEADRRCELCGTTREKTNLHHLIPKLVLKRRRNSGKKDHPTILARLCHACHHTLHDKFNHATLAKGFASIEAIEQQPEMSEYLTKRRADVERFEGWVKQ